MLLCCTMMSANRALMVLAAFILMVLWQAGGSLLAAQSHAIKSSCTFAPTSENGLALQPVSP